MYILKHFPRLLFFILCFTLACTSCSKEDTPPTPEPEEELPTPEEEGPVVLQNEVNDFIWLGLNEIYLWQDKVPNLADNKFNNTDDYFSFLNTYNSPEDLFESLLYRRGEVDRFSFLVNDYIALENSFQGTTLSNGLDFGLVRIGNTNDVLGYVRYVANGSDASTKDIKRGELFLTVDGQQLTVSNYYDLLFGNNSSYTLGIATISNSQIELTNKNVTLTKTNFTENPIHINKVIELNGTKIGYLMYNSFIANFDSELNNSIAELKSQGITELVLDLRYNPGGRVSSALALCSMITGQFENDIIITEQWNPKYQAYFEQVDPDFLINRFPKALTDDSPITTLNLNKVYVLTTGGSASASELVINGLDPYIDVVQIGTNTAGKYTASITLYDAPDFSRDNANPNHTYAMQPLVYKSSNINGVSDYDNGLTPDHIITYQTNSGSSFEGENIENLGELGEDTDPFLAKALSLISGTTTKSYENLKAVKGIKVDHIAESNDFKPLGKGMYTTLKTK
ncbi:peptidase S41 [Tamlana sp. s12]|uniref:S41 family peptidase n=1 Tax=Tamlana sp. s12 TaxID=1630406 RepID=UPI000838668E|nr:S41 family peptidase [Tamlana sp. s12]QQY83916.1 peptidase S41 [Tamlana sp. s12]